MSDLKVFRRQQSEHVTMTIAAFAQILVHMIADVNFQAGQWTRWTVQLQSEYIRSLITGEAPSDIILSDNQECAKCWEGVSNSDFKYFKNWLEQKIKWLIVDGHNRKVAIADFLANKVPIPCGFYMIEHRIQIGGETKVLKFSGKIDNDNNTYETMPPRLKEIFNNLPITITSYTNSSREELSDLFIQVNSGKELNQPEKRNAKTSQIATVIRNIATEFVHIFNWKGTKWFDAKDFNRRALDAYFAKMAYMWCADDVKSNCDDKNLWDMYAVDSPQDKNFKEVDKKLRQFIKEILSNKKLRAIPNKNCIFDLWIIWLNVVKDDKHFLKDEIDQFIVDYIKVCSDLVQDKTLHESPPEFSKNAWKDPKSFELMIGGLQPQNNVLRNRLILDRLDVDKYVEDNRPRVVNDWTKLGVALEQDLITPDGSEIMLEKLQTADYHKGHKHTPHKDGGHATWDNTVIQTKEENLTLGATPVE